MCNKTDIANRLCYTQLVYGRIRKKLMINLDDDSIEKLLLSIIKDSQSEIVRKGKNHYISHEASNIIVTVNSHTFRVITASKLNRSKEVSVER